MPDHRGGVGGTGGVGGVPGGPGGQGGPGGPGGGYTDAQRLRGWERFAPWVAGIAAAIALVALPTIVWQQYHYNEVQKGYTTETISLLNEHTNTLNEVHQLRTEVTKLVQQYGPDLTQGQQQIVAEYTWIACSLQNGPTNCGAVPAP